MNETRTANDASTIECFQAIFSLLDPLAPSHYCTGLIHDTPLTFQQCRGNAVLYGSHS
jgi:hypothetical protein